MNVASGLQWHAVRGNMNGKQESDKVMQKHLRNMLASTIVVSVSAVAMTMAHADETTTPLLKQEFKGMENMEANIVLIEADPGWETQRHIHPGHVFLYVLEGEIELSVEGKDPVKISAGQTVYETPDKPMVGRNASSTEKARLIVFQVGEAGKELTMPASN